MSTVEVNFPIRRGGISLISYNTMQVVSKEKINLFLDSALNNCEKMIFLEIGLFWISYTKDGCGMKGSVGAGFLGNVNFLALHW